MTKIHASNKAELEQLMSKENVEETAGSEASKSATSSPLKRAAQVPVASSSAANDAKKALNAAKKRSLKRL